MKKKKLLFIIIVFCLSFLPLGNTFADSDEPQPPDFSGPTWDPSGDEPETPLTGGTAAAIPWNRVLYILKSKTPKEIYIKISDEDINGEDACGEECVKTGDGYSYENGVLTLDSFGLEDELTIAYRGKLPLEIKLNGTNNFDLDALLAEQITLSGNGTMNGNIISYSDELVAGSADIENNGATINANKIFNEYGSIILNNGKINANGTISAQKVEVNGGSLNINSETAGIEIINRFWNFPSEEFGLVVNGGDVSIVAKENVIREGYGFQKYDSEKEEWIRVSEEDTDKFYGDLIVLGEGVGAKETDITMQRYKILNDSIIGVIDDAQDELYTYYASLSYGDYKITKGGTSIRDAVKVLHISKDFKNKISKNSKIGVIDTLKNVKLQYEFRYTPSVDRPELEKIEIDGKTIDPSKYNASRDDGHIQIYAGTFNIDIPPTTLFELGTGKHTILIHFKEPGVKEYIYEEYNHEVHTHYEYRKEYEYEFEIAKSFKDYEYLLTYIDNPILEGEDETLILGDSASYRVSFDRNIQLFDGFSIDGKEVPEKYYEVKSGSTIIEIKPEFLNTLSLGKHEISANFLAEDEPLSTNFTMTEAKKESKPEDKDKKTEDKTVNNPGTGLYSKDSSFVSSSTLITVAIIVAVSTIALAIWSIKTKRFKH